MSANTYGYQEGMKVFVQTRKWNGKPITTDDLREQTITKIGRTWITLSNGDRFCPERMMIDGKGYGHTDRVWNSVSEFTESLAVNKTWLQFYRSLTGSAPSGMTVEDIVNIAAVCGIKLADQNDG